MAKPLVDDELWAAVKQWGGGVASVIGPRSASTPGRRPFPRRTTKIGPGQGGQFISGKAPAIAMAKWSLVGWAGRAF